MNVKFRRQQPIGKFIVDFCCWEKKVILEFDGESHVGKEEYDAQRKEWLESTGWRVIRIWDAEVFGNVGGVMQMIYSACNDKFPHPADDTAVRRPSPGGRGEQHGN